jgi:hypothetical protein
MPRRKARRSFAPETVMIIITVDGTENEHAGCHHIRRDGFLYVLDRNDKLVASYLEANIRKDGVIDDEKINHTTNIPKEIIGGYQA